MSNSLHQQCGCLSLDHPVGWATTTVSGLPITNQGRGSFIAVTRIRITGPSSPVTTTDSPSCESLYPVHSPRSLRERSIPSCTSRMPDFESRYSPLGAGFLVNRKALFSFQRSMASLRPSRKLTIRKRAFAGIERCAALKSDFGVAAASALKSALSMTARREYFIRPLVHDNRLNHRVGLSVAFMPSDRHLLQYPPCLRPLWPCPTSPGPFPTFATGIRHPELALPLRNRPWRPPTPAGCGPAGRRARENL